MSLLPAAIVRTSKADVVYEELRRQLVSGERPSGQVFSTYELAEHFGVSRRPVMDAVARLQADGFVQIESQVGCRVVIPTPQELRDHVEFSIGLQSYACRLAAQRATPDDHRAIQDAYAELDVAVRAGDVTGYERLNVDFHMAVVEASGNQRLADSVRHIWDLSRFFRYLRPPEDLAAPQAEHQALLDAILAGDAATAQRVIEAHQARALQMIGGSPAGPAAW